MESLISRVIEVPPTVSVEDVAAKLGRGRPDSDPAAALLWVGIPGDNSRAAYKFLPARRVYVCLILVFFRIRACKVRSELVGLFNQVLHSILLRFLYYHWIRGVVFSTEASKLCGFRSLLCYSLRCMRGVTPLFRSFIDWQ